MPPRRRSSPRPDAVACPDCGERFAPRGLAAHRRARHPAAERTGKGPVSGRRPAARAEAAEETSPAAVRVLADALERIETRLGRIEAAAAGDRAARALRPSTREEVEVLLVALEDVMDRVAREVVRHRELRASWGGEPQSSDELSSDREARQRLGRLRREQVALLHRLGGHAPGAPGDGDETWFVPF